MTTWKEFQALLQELDRANPFRAAELAKQVEAATESLRAPLRELERQKATHEEAFSQFADLAREQARFVEAVRHETESLTRLQNDQLQELLSKQKEFERMVSELAAEQERLKKLLAQDQPPGA